MCEGYGARASRWEDFDSYFMTVFVRHVNPVPCTKYAKEPNQDEILCRGILDATILIIAGKPLYRF